MSLSLPARPWSARAAWLPARASRGGRFRARQAGAAEREARAKEDFALLAALPAWLDWPVACHDELAVTAALVAMQRDIDRLLCGATLRALDAACPAGLLATVLDETPDPALPARPLAEPAALPAIGHALLVAALPVALAPRFPGAQGERGARRLTARAERILLRRRAA